MNEIKKEIIEVGKRLWQRGYVAANDGNISVKISDSKFLTTATGVSKGFMDESDVVLVDDKGNLLEGMKKASSELPMHLEIYKKRDDVLAVVHSHPPTATGFAAAGIEMDKGILPEVILTLGNVKLTPYGTTGTDELARIVAEGISKNNGLLLQNHGAVTVGTSLMQAYYRMETLEHFANITLVTRILGRQSVLGQEEIAKLFAKTGSKAPEFSDKSSGEKSEKFMLSRDDLTNIIYDIIKQINNQEDL
ncbi:MAG: class II aldolase/adducin family protein [Acidobacteria bacterium]|nr:class II aldolase/adducin family protein [Acidobacteriota bacterium]